MKSNSQDNYFKLWALVLPIASICVVPSNQGTTPGYILAFLSIPFVLLFSGAMEKRRYIRDYFIFIIVFVGLVFTSQFILVFSPTVDFRGAYLIDYADRITVLLRGSMFTQSLYFIATISLLLFVINFYKKTWDRYLFSGAILLGIYGIYEFVYFLLFHTNGDILSNRVIGGRIASLFALNNFGSLIVMRLKSLTGEPSMYSLAILPYWIYAMHLKKTKTHLFLFITLILTTSGSAVLGIITYAIVNFFIFNRSVKKTAIGIPVLVLVYLLQFNQINHYIQGTLLNKINLDSGSGVQRFDIYTANMDLFNSLNVMQQFFGIGFGYVRSTELFSTILVNNGIIGLIILTALFFYPVFKLKNNHENVGIKLALIVSFVVMMASVPELYYLTTWLFLGMAYNTLRAERLSFTLEVKTVASQQYRTAHLQY